jgi:hypothetical protein
MRILGVSQALTVLILVIFVLVPFGAAEALKAGDPGGAAVLTGMA